MHTVLLVLSTVSWVASAETASATICSRRSAAPESTSATSSWRAGAYKRSRWFWGPFAVKQVNRVPSGGPQEGAFLDGFVEDLAYTRF